MDERKKKLVRDRKKKSRMLQKEIEMDMQNVVAKTEANEQVKTNINEGGASSDTVDDSSITTEEAIINIQNDCNQSDNYISEDDFEARDSSHSENNPSEHSFAEPSSSTPMEIEEIRQWAVENNVSHKQLSGLLNILGKRLLPDLPSKAQTFLSTAKASYEIRKMQNCSINDEPGEFVYFGIAEGLRKCIAEFHEGEIELLINVDGLPITKSGKTALWPILCKVFYYPDIYRPFVVAMYCGVSKPKDVHDYFADFITELNNLHDQGFTLNERVFNVKLKAIIADTPARCFCKGTKGHGGYGACERCVVYGTAIKVAGEKKQIVYPGVVHRKRTNMSFRERMDPEHHVGNSPLELIKPEIDMTAIFPLDFMRLVCVGATKKILELLLNGPLKVRLSVRMKRELSRRMMCLKAQLVTEFQKKPRSVDCVAKWKATEFRFFLLYCGPFVLKNLLSKNHYNHFLLLHTSFRILCSETLVLQFKEKARRYLQLFVLSMPILYGEESQVINMHNLCHIVDDVDYFGCDLSRINCFPFGNHRAAIKRLIRTPNRPLVQFCRRKSEYDNIVSVVPKEIPSKYKIQHRISNKGGISVGKLFLNCETIISTSTPNNVVLMENGKVAVINRIFKKENECGESLYYIEAKIYKKKMDAFSYPTKSSKVHVWKLETNSSVVRIYHITNIDRKLVTLKLAQKPNGTIRTYVLSLLHA